MGLIEKGQSAPDFTLKGQYDNEVTLSDFTGKGKNVLLSFHPLAWTSVCEVQMRCLEIKAPVFDKLDTVAFGISVDSAPCKKEWAEFIDAEKTLLLADFWPHGRVAKDYGIFLEDKGISGRCHICVGKDGKVMFTRNYEILEIPDIEEIINMIKT